MFHLLKISSNAFRAPLICVANPLTALHQKFATLLPDLIESREHGFDIITVLYCFVCEELGHYGGIFDAQPRACAVMGRSCVRGISDNGNATLCVRGWWVNSQVENCPLSYIVSCLPSRDALVYTHHIQVLVRQFQQAHHVVAVAGEVFQSIFSMCRGGQLVWIHPSADRASLSVHLPLYACLVHGILRFVRRSESNDIQSLTMIDGKCQDVSVGAHLRDCQQTFILCAG